MDKQIIKKTAVPLLASWGWNDHIQAPSTKTSEEHKALQNLRWETATAIDRDFREILQFVAPSCENFGCHSARIVMLLVRVCIEIESCFKSVLSENGVSRRRQNNIKDFAVVERSHTLSRYAVKIHGWRQPSFTFHPFKSWESVSGAGETTLSSPSWYCAYGKVKHNILEADGYGTFENLCLAISGLHVLLLSQFGRDDWGPNRGSVSFYHAPEYECVVGDVVEVRFPPKDECHVVYDLPRTEDYQTESFNYT